MLEKELSKRQARRRLTDYRPYAKQLTFHAAGATHRERMLMAGNQLGKTLSASYETAMHLTGRYPPWWTGWRAKGPVRWLAGSETSEVTRKGVQRLLLGPPENPSEWGTGAIPAECIVSTSKRQGVPDAVSIITVKSDLGGLSSIQLQTYDQGRTKWQADTVDGIWFDEEPPEDIYFEGLTRTNVTRGPVYVTLTPLLGISSVVKRFYMDKPESTSLTMMSIEDAEHYSPETRAKIIADYPEHVREARTKGIPQLGSGRIFPVSEGAISVAAFPIPEHWPRIGGLDFGWDHPSAGVLMAWDRDADTLYITHCHRAKHQTPVLFAGSVKGWGNWPWSWPHDGLQHDKGSGEQLAKQYKAQGLNLLAERAHFSDGTFGVEAGVGEMLERMQTGRWKVFAHLTEWFEEFHLYHRDEGLIVKKDDDLLCASRYAMMMRRYAKTAADLKPKKAAFVPPPPPQPSGWMS